MQTSQESTCGGVFFNKVAGPQNRRLQHRFFHMNCVNYPRTPILSKIYERLFLKHQCSFLKTCFFTEHLQWLLLTVSGFQPATLLRKRRRERYLSINFAKFLGTSLDSPDDCFLCLSVNFEKFFRLPLL